ncbi:MAG: hypothetical protein ABFS24_05105 [Pseudomonadota bacterium]
MKTTPSVLLLSLLLMLSLAASAADIRVRVFERGNQVPLVNAAVCLGTSARIDQFGARMTDDEGYVSFTDVPRAALLITVSRQGYMAEQETLVTSTANRMLVMSLSTGGGGTPCPLDNSVSRVYDRGLSVSRFTLNNGKAVTANRTVTLDNQASGQATQYRASERADFSGANWQEYTTAPAFQLSPDPGKKTVYFQVRRHATAGDANIETLSPTVRDSISLQ